MCGITGYWLSPDTKPVADSILRKMTEKLQHRGPDDQGFYIEPRLGLGHRRLSIIDPDQRSRQPLKAVSSQNWIVFNGEIYNYQSLKDELITKNYVFNTESDTEVILNGYCEWGHEILQRLEGIFAFAIWDQGKKELFIARDHLGVKPLYYSGDNSFFTFASEVKALLEFPLVNSRPDYLGLDSYFALGYIPAPLTSYQNVKQLKPGHFAIINQNLNISIKKYWTLDLAASKHTGTEEELVEEFDRLFMEAVKKQMVSDVPIGLFLSGGKDSYAIGKAMTMASSQPFQAFCLGFQQASYDETQVALKVAKSLQIPLEHKKMQSDFESILGKIKNHGREPFADSSSVPTYELSKLASDKVKVVLSGDGADELLGGYFTYNANRYADFYRIFPKFLRSPLMQIFSKLIPETGNRYSLKQKISRFHYAAEKGKLRDHATWRIILRTELRKQIYSDDFWHEVKDFDPIAQYEDIINIAVNNGCSALDACLFADLSFYLPNDMLTKVDRMSMLNGLEVRVPFLDRELVEFCWRLPEKFKIKKFKNKYLLRKSRNFAHPDKNIVKKGFNIPIFDRKLNDFLKAGIFSGNQFQSKSLRHLLNFETFSYIPDDPFLKYSLFMLDSNYKLGH